MRNTWISHAVMFCLVANATAGDTVSFSRPALDRWSYPFSGNGGEQEARVFSALGSEGLDERDSQFIVAFDTTTGGTSPIPAGLGAGNYTVTLLRLTGTVSSTVGTFAYDGSYDPFVTYLAADDPGYQPDADAGRPLELFGVQFVAGYSRFGFGSTTDGTPPAYEENNAFGFGPPMGRYVHPLAFDAGGTPTTVSNNVDLLNEGAAGIDVKPFAVGATNLADGAVIAANQTVVFDVDVTDPYINEYIQDGLDSGQLGFVLTTLATSENLLRFYTKEFPAGSPVTMQIEYSVVPEPGAFGLALATFAFLGAVIWLQLGRSHA